MSPGCCLRMTCQDLNDSVSCIAKKIAAVCTRRQMEEAHDAAIDDLRQEQGAELHRQAAAHAALCQELHARADAHAGAVAKLASDAAASQQVRMHLSVFADWI